jgi:hypothetical protein
MINGTWVRIMGESMDCAEIVDDDDIELSSSGAALHDESKESAMQRRPDMYTHRDRRSATEANGD